MHRHNMNGPSNGPTSSHLQTDAITSIVRPFTLQEALPYSPQTSTIPFIPDIIPDPSLGSGSPALNVTNLFSRDEFDRINAEALSQSQTSKMMKQYVDSMVQDLKPGQRTKYNFRQTPRSRSSTSSTTGRGMSQRLTPVAKAVHERVETYFKQTKSSKPPTSDAKVPVVNGTPKVPSTPKTTKRPDVNKSKSPAQKKKAKAVTDLSQPPNVAKLEVGIAQSAGFDPSAYVSVDNSLSSLDHQRSNLTQQQNAADVSTSNNNNKHVNGASDVLVELPVNSDINPDEYMAVGERLDAPHYLSSRKDDEHMREPGDNNVVGSSLDQRQRADAALDTLNTHIRSIYSAVGKALSLEPGYEHLIIRISDSEVTMTGPTQQKLHGAIQKTIDLKSFGMVAIEKLIQVIKLSEGGIQRVEDLDMHIDEGWDEAGADAWLQQFDDIDTGLKAARTCLRVMSGGRDDKRLYSETTIMKCMNLGKAMAEDIIIPLVELRSSGPSANIFKILFKHKKALSSIFMSCQRLFSVIAELITKIELSDAAINLLEYTASKLIFVENAYQERESAVGVQKFDGIRSVAMDILSQIFLIKPEQRQGIIDDILTSLEKLPVGKLSSRQFKLSDGGSIQPVSALIMRLVQASSGQVDLSGVDRRAALLENINNEDDDDTGGEREKQSRPMNSSSSSIMSETQASQQHAIAIQELDATATPLTDAAARNASYVINFIVKRAVGSTKSGDTPYRNLLDLFVEDFTTCLDSPDWPSAELLLRLLMLMMVQLFEGAKTAAPAKNMALELLGTMSAAISRLRSHVKRTASSFDGGDSEDFSRYLADLALLVLEPKADATQLVDWAGPYRASVEHIQARCSEDPHLSSAVSYLTVDWAARVQAIYDRLEHEDADRDESLGKLAYRLRHMIDDRQWLSTEYVFKPVSPNQAKFSYSILLLKSPLCESFDKILNILLGSMASDQATVRSKSLKSINQVLETDPSILDGDSTVIHLILECASDSSTQVRDSALGLLGNCIAMRPVLEPNLTPKIIDRFQDAGVGVRKRAMKLARDIYLRNRNKSIRSAIANGLLRRVQDPDEGVRDLARQMIEEIWFVPFYTDDGTATFQTAIAEHVSLIIQTVKTGTVTEILDKVFQTILRPHNKSLEGPFSVCSKLVSDMFGLLDNPESEDASAPSGRDALQVLTIFAKADPKLFNFEQIRLLKPQLASFSGAEELAAFRAVSVIYKRVLPQLTTVNSTFLAEVRLQLLKGIGKISSRGALDDLIACAKVVCDLLNDLGPMANVVASGLAGIQRLGAGQMDAKRLQILSAYSIIVGNVAKHCDLDQQLQVFRDKIPKWQGDSVPRLIVDVLAPFTAAQQPLDARKAALEAIGLVCQAWPRNYALAKVYTAFQQVFHDQIPALETMILRSFKEFLVGEERRSEASAVAPTDGKKKELTVMGGTNFDDVASATTQRFLKDITRIAMGSQDEHAFLAMENLGSISRQGLTHPKETGVPLITLETSANRKIAELAFMEHRSIHEKHETVLEREYIKAVQSAYEYQRDVVKDSHGATTDPFQSKLHLLIEVLKISKMKNRQRFFEKLCAQVDFDLSKLDVSDTFPAHADFSRFVVENMAFFEYQTIGELQTTVNKMEKIVATTGATVAQAIESEIFKVTLDAAGGQLNNAAAATTTSTVVGTELQQDGSAIEVAAATAAPVLGAGVNPKRFRQLSTAALILLNLWEVRTHLRRVYGMGTHRHDNKAKGAAKDLNKAPVKVPGIHGDKLWDELIAHSAGLDSIEQMGALCRGFVELMNVDKEFKVTHDDDDDDVGLDDPATPSEADDDAEPSTERGRKRKGGNTPGGRKKRARSGSRKRSRPSKNGGMDSDEDVLDDEW